MDNNLPPRFILIYDMIEVNEMPKVHIEYPIVEYCVIFMEVDGLKIPIHLWGVLSFLLTLNPTQYKT